MSEPPDDDEKVVSFRPDQPDQPRTYAKTLISNSRRYGENECMHRGPYLFDRRLATVECRDCGALLNPLFVLEMLAARESYWNTRQAELSAYLAELNKEIEGRTRTKCTHCGNMTAIKYKHEPPRTWFPQPY